ncbi:importin subunit beta-3 [Leucoagaricus gongylophorus]
MVWLNDDPSLSSGTVDDSTPSLYEQSIDRVACAFGISVVYPPVFEKFPPCSSATTGEPVKLDSWP